MRNTAINGQITKENEIQLQIRLAAVRKKGLVINQRLKKTRGNEHANDKNVLMTAKRIRHWSSFDFMPKQFRNILHGISLKITCFILQKYTTVELTKSSGKRMIDPMLNIEGKKKHLPRHHIELIAVVCITQERVLFCSARLKERTVF